MNGKGAAPRLACLVLLAAVAAPGTGLCQDQATPPDRESPEEMYKRAESMERGSLEDKLRVEQLLLQAIDAEQDPENKARYLAGLAQLYDGMEGLREGSWKAAAGALEKALELSTDPDARLGYLMSLAGEYQMLGRYDEALEAYRQVIELAPFSEQERVAAGAIPTIWNSRGELKQRVAELERRIQENPQDRVSLFILAQVHLQVDRNDAKASRVCNQLLPLMPGSNQVAGYLFYEYKGRGELSTAEKIALRFASSCTHPDQREALVDGLLALWEEEGVLDKALAEVTNRSAKNPADVGPATILFRGYTWYRPDDSKAVKALEILHAQEPGCLSHATRLAELYRRTGRADQAAPIYRSWILAGRSTGVAEELIEKLAAALQESGGLQAEVEAVWARIPERQTAPDGVDDLSFLCQAYLYLEPGPELEIPVFEAFLRQVQVSRKVAERLFALYGEQGLQRHGVRFIQEIYPSVLQDHEFFLRSGAGFAAGAGQPEQVDRFARMHTTNKSLKEDCFEEICERAWFISISGAPDVAVAHIRSSLADTQGLSPLQRDDLRVALVDMLIEAGSLEQALAEARALLEASFTSISRWQAERYIFVLENLRETPGSEPMDVAEPGELVVELYLSSRSQGLEDVRAGLARAAEHLPMEVCEKDITVLEHFTRLRRLEHRYAASRYSDLVVWLDDRLIEGRDQIMGLLDDFLAGKKQIGTVFLGTKPETKDDRAREQPGLEHPVVDARPVTVLVSPPVSPGRGLLATWIRPYARSLWFFAGGILGGVVLSVVLRRRSRVGSN